MPNSANASGFIRACASSRSSAFAGRFIFGYLGCPLRMAAQCRKGTCGCFPFLWLIFHLRIFQRSLSYIASKIRNADGTVGRRTLIHAHTDLVSGKLDDQVRMPFILAIAPSASETMVYSTKP